MYSYLRGKILMDSLPSFTFLISSIGQPTSGNILRSSNNEWMNHFAFESLSLLSPRTCNVWGRRGIFYRFSLIFVISSSKVPQLLSCLLSLVEHNFLAQRGNWEEDHHRTHPAHHVVHLSEVRNLLKEPPSGSGPDDVVCRAVDIVFNTAAAFAE